MIMRMQPINNNYQSSRHTATVIPLPKNPNNINESLKPLPSSLLPPPPNCPCTFHFSSFRCLVASLPFRWQPFLSPSEFCSNHCVICGGYFISGGNCSSAPSWHEIWLLPSIIYTTPSSANVCLLQSPKPTAIVCPLTKLMSLRDLPDVPDWMPPSVNVFGVLRTIIHNHYLWTL
jgi:hypothetical protein